MTDLTGVYELENAYKTWRWLCRRHLSKLKAAGWSAKRIGETPFPCDLCEQERQAKETSDAVLVPKRDVE